MSLTKAPFGGKSVVWDHYKLTRIFDSTTLHLTFLHSNQPARPGNYHFWLYKLQTNSQGPISRNQTKRVNVPSPALLVFARFARLPPFPVPETHKILAPKNCMGLGSSLLSFLGAQNCLFFHKRFQRWLVWGRFHHLRSLTCLPARDLKIPKPTDFCHEKTAGMQSIYKSE